MFMNRQELEAACGWVCFSDGQLEAVTRAWRKTAASPELEGLAREDARQLADPQGPTRLLADPETLRAQLGDEAGLYPVLILLSRVRWLCGQYERLGIERQVLTDTLSDIPLWLDNSQRRFGVAQMREYGWLTNHMRLRLFRLGRLQYIHTESRVPAWFFENVQDGRVTALAQEGMRFDAALGELSDDCAAPETRFCLTPQTAQGHPIDQAGRIGPQTVALERSVWRLALAPGDPVLDVHIPEGPPLDPDQVAQSLRRAPAFFAEKLGLCDAKAFTCESWLMSPALSAIMPQSRLAAFQAMFRAVPYTLSDKQVFERVYGCARAEWNQLPMETRLQRGVRDWYASGRNCRQMQGVRLMPKGDVKA